MYPHYVILSTSQLSLHNPITSETLFLENPV